MKIRNCLLFVVLVGFMSMFSAFAKPNYNLALQKIEENLSLCTYDDSHASAVGEDVKKRGFNAFGGNEFIIADLERTHRGNCSTFSRYTAQIFEEAGIPNLIVETFGLPGHDGHLFNLYKNEKGEWTAFDPTFFVELRQFENGTHPNCDVVREYFSNHIEMGIKEFIYKKPLTQHLKFLSDGGQARCAVIWDLGASEHCFKDQPRFLGIDIMSYSKILQIKTGKGLLLSSKDKFPYNLAAGIGSPFNSETEKNDRFNMYGRLVQLLSDVSETSQLPANIIGIIRDDTIFPLYGNMKHLVESK